MQYTGPITVGQAWAIPATPTFIVQAADIHVPQNGVMA